MIGRTRAAIASAILLPDLWLANLAILQSGRRRVELDVMNQNRPNSMQSVESRDDRVAEFLELYSTNYPAPSVFCDRVVADG